MSNKFKSIYAELGLLRDVNENSILTNLTKNPKKEPKKITPHTTASVAFATEQVDTLYLPEDDGYKYLLVVVDVATRMCDAEPMKTRDAKTTKNTLTKIYKRGIVKKPMRIEVDDGTEFKGDFEAHFKKFFKILRKMTGRHRQQSLVETKNQQIGKILNQRMLAEEINNDDTSKNWTDVLPKVIELLNKHFSHKAVRGNPDLPIKTDDFSKEILEEGTRVRVQLDNPVSYVDDKRLNGRFRTGDIRWSKKISVITRFYLRPNQPVMYQVDNDDTVAYTKYQLQIVKDDEMMPPPTAQRDFYAQEIVGKKTIRGKVWYEVRWEDGDITDMEGVEARKQLPEMVKEFNARNRRK
jgi:hypothetical protein